MQKKLYTQAKLWYTTLARMSNSLYAPVAQLDSASDSDVSGPIRSEPAQPIEISGFQPMQRKISFAVDYCLTTIFEKANHRRKAIIPHTRL